MADRWDYRDDRGYRERYERPMTERAGDEVRSWFGDDEAARRRRMDKFARSATSATGMTAQRAPASARGNVRAKPRAT